MDVWLISVVVGGAAGVLGGVAVNWLLDPNRLAMKDEPSDRFVPDASIDERVDDVARDWARHHGRPGSEKLVADKLRLGWRLQQRRRKDLRARSRWSRW